MEVIVSIFRLATLADDNREKIDNRKYLKFGFVIPAAVLAALLMILSFYLLVKD